MGPALRGFCAYIRMKNLLPAFTMNSLQTRSAHGSHAPD